MSGSWHEIDADAVVCLDHTLHQYPDGVCFSCPDRSGGSAGAGQDSGDALFTNELGGNMMNFANLIWIWGHPEVYILILPAFGVFSEVTAVFSRKRLFGYRSLVYATMAIGLLSFTVWLHHFFTMGSSQTLTPYLVLPR